MEHGGTKWTDLEQAVEQEFLSKIIPVSNLSLGSRRRSAAPRSSSEPCKGGSIQIQNLNLFRVPTYSYKFNFLLSYL